MSTSTATEEKTKLIPAIRITTKVGSVVRKLDALVLGVSFSGLELSSAKWFRVGEYIASHGSEADGDEVLLRKIISVEATTITELDK